LSERASQKQEGEGKQQTVWRGKTGRHCPALSTSLDLTELSCASNSRYGWVSERIGDWDSYRGGVLPRCKVAGMEWAMAALGAEMLRGLGLI